MTAIPKLSFCIPTYNYGDYIRTAIDSVRGQAQPGVEVLVLDGGSTDSTRQVVESVASAWPGVRYVRQETRGGIDADLARTVELARGEYCWLLSADDALQDGAVRRILEEFDGGNDIVLCDRVWCDAELRPIHSHSWFDHGTKDRIVDLSQPAGVLSYLQAAQSLGALFSFMSCIGFRREPWMRAAAETPSIACYSHVGRLFAMGRAGARFKYVATPLVLCRGGTDSFRAGGLVRRLLVDLRGYRDLAKALFPADQPSRNAFLAVMRREHPLRRWIGARGLTADHGLWREVARELREYGFTGLELALIDALGSALRLIR